MGHRVMIVIIEGIGGEEEVWILHLHVVIEHRHLRLRVILAPVGGQRRFTVDHLTPLEEIGVIIDTVEIEGVCVEYGLTMSEHDIVSGTRYLLIAVVVGVVAEE